MQKKGTVLRADSFFPNKNFLTVASLVLTAEKLVQKIHREDRDDSGRTQQERELPGGGGVVAKSRAAGLGNSCNLWTTGYMDIFCHVLMTPGYKGCLMHGKMEPG